MNLTEFGNMRGNGKHCSDCLNYAKCLLERKDPDAINNVEITDRFHCFEALNFYEVCKALVDYVDKPYYRICPKCNKDHNGSCKNCAWASCITSVGCTTFGYWSDGQYRGDKMHVIEKILCWNEIPTIAKELNNKVFMCREDAERRLEELRHDS